MSSAARRCSAGAAGTRGRWPARSADGDPRPSSSATGSLPAPAGRLRQRHPAARQPLRPRTHIQNALMYRKEADAETDHLSRESTGGTNPEAQRPICRSPPRRYRVHLRAYQAGAAIVHVHVRDARESRPRPRPLPTGRSTAYRRRCDIRQPDHRRCGTRRGNAELELSRSSQASRRGRSTRRRVLWPRCHATQLAGGIRGAGEPGDSRSCTRAGSTMPPTRSSEGLLDAPSSSSSSSEFRRGRCGPRETLIHLVESIPAGSTWAVDGIGDARAPHGPSRSCSAVTRASGRGSDSITSHGELATSNAQLVARVARLAAESVARAGDAGQAREVARAYQVAVAAGGRGGPG